MDYKFLLTFAISGLSLYFTYKQIRLMEAQAGMASIAQVAPVMRLKRYWPLVTMCLLTLVCWIPYYLQPPVDYFHGWGISPDPEKIWAVVDGHKLMSKRPNRVMLMARVADSTMDSKTDNQMARSATFEIQDFPMMRIEIVLSPEFISRMGKVGYADEYLLEVPQDLPIESIHTLADAEKRGAKILGVKAGGGGPVVSGGDVN
jgi:hypothetical protein